MSGVRIAAPAWKPPQAMRRDAPAEPRPPRRRWIPAPMLFQPTREEPNAPSMCWWKRAVKPRPPIATSPYARIPIVNQLPAPPPATILEEAGPRVKFPNPASTLPRTRIVRIAQATPPSTNGKPMNRPAQGLRIVSMVAQEGPTRLNRTVRTIRAKRTGRWFKMVGVPLVRHHGRNERRHHRGTSDPEESGRPRRKAPGTDGHLPGRSRPLPLLLPAVRLRGDHWALPGLLHPLRRAGGRRGPEPRAPPREGRPHDDHLQRPELPRGVRGHGAER